MKKIFFLMIFQSFGFYACQGQVDSGAFNILLKTMLNESVPTISVAELSQMDYEKVQFLDAREKGEYEVSHLQNARWIGYEDFDLLRMDGIEKNKEIIIYCSIGVRSEKIGEKLLEEGYTNVNNLYGSIFEWVNQGNPVFNMDNQQTTKVHAYSKKWGIWLKKGEKVYD